MGGGPLSWASLEWAVVWRFDRGWRDYRGWGPWERRGPREGEERDKVRRKGSSERRCFYWPLPLSLEPALGVAGMSGAGWGEEQDAEGNGKGMDMCDRAQKYRFGFS